MYTVQWLYIVQTTEFLQMLWLFVMQFQFGWYIWTFLVPSGRSEVEGKWENGESLRPDVGEGREDWLKLSIDIQKSI